MLGQKNVYENYGYIYVNLLRSLMAESAIEIKSILWLQLSSLKIFEHDEKFLGLNEFS